MQMTQIQRNLLHDQKNICINIETEGKDVNSLAKQIGKFVDEPNILIVY